MVRQLSQIKAERPPPAFHMESSHRIVLFYFKLYNNYVLSDS